jgi:hypothetical protein
MPDGLWTVWTTRRGIDLTTLPTAPTMTEWVTFRLSNGYFFDCQDSDENSQVGHFSIVKWALFRLTKTGLGSFWSVEVCTGISA